MRPCGKPFLKTERASPGRRSLRASAQAQAHSILLFISESRQLPGMKGTAGNVSLTRETVTTIAGHRAGLGLPLRGSANPAGPRAPPHPRWALRCQKHLLLLLLLLLQPRAATAASQQRPARRFEHIALSPALLPLPGCVRRGAPGNSHFPNIS